jgi:flavoprotein
MRISEQALLVIEQLKQAVNDMEVEAIVSASAEASVNKKAYFEKLETLIENISPLECNSQQWRNFRIARIHLGQLSLLEGVPA